MDDIRSAIDSIYSFIDRTSEQVADGYRWQTIDYGDQPQYHFHLFNGVGGIPLFLRDYFALTGNPRAKELARGAVAWCLKANPAEGNFQRGVQFGKTGIAFASLYLDTDPASSAIPEACELNAAHLLSEPVGPVTDLIGGEASNGWFLLKLWEKSGDDRYLQGAIRCGRWIADHLVRDELGTHCLIRPDGQFGTSPSAGLSHGIAGVAHLFVLLFKATGQTGWKAIALELFETLSRHAVPIHDGWNWSPKLGEKELTRCQHSHGAAGIGLILVKAAVAFENSDLLDAARKAAVATYAYGDFRKNPTLCTGLAGSGELFVELFKATGDEIWWDRAKEFARLAMAYKVTESGLDFWPTDSLGLYSPDYAYGASGTGHFFLRTLRPSHVEFPLL